MSTREPTELERLCTQLEITCEAKHVALIPKVVDGDWAKDEWRVTLGYKGKTYTSPFYCGLGHRKLNRFEAELVNGVYVGRAGSGHPNTRNEVLAAQHGWTRPEPPDAADVLSCLASEADACEKSFVEWCSDLGENNDSIKVRDTYLACQKTGDALLRLFGKEVLDKLRAAEH